MKPFQTHDEEDPIFKASPASRLNLVDVQNVKVLPKTINNIKKDFFLKDTNIPIRCSIGISIYPDHGLKAEELQINADTAMYRSKSNKNSDFSFYNREAIEV